LRRTSAARTVERGLRAWWACESACQVPRRCESAGNQAQHAVKTYDVSCFMLTSLDLEPNFILHEPTHDAEPPEWPHVVCEGEVGGAGYAWHPDPVRRRCFTGRTEAPVELIAEVLGGRPIDRVWALRRIVVGEEPGVRWPGVVAMLWRCQCPGCRRCHLKLALLYRRAAESLHPGAVEALRIADPSIRSLLAIDVPPERRYKIGHPPIQPPGLPVRATDEETRLAQIAWALDLIARHDHPLDVRRRRRRIIHDVNPPLPHDTD